MGKLTFTPVIRLLEENPKGGGVLFMSPEQVYKPVPRL